MVSYQAFIWTNTGFLLVGPIGTNLSKIRIKIHWFSLKIFILKCCLQNGCHCFSLIVYTLKCHDICQISSSILNDVDSTPIPKFQEPFLNFRNMFWTYGACTWQIMTGSCNFYQNVSLNHGRVPTIGQKYLNFLHNQPWISPWMKSIYLMS